VSAQWFKGYGKPSECGQPARGKHAGKKCGKYKICDEGFYSCWVPGLVPFQLVWANYPAKSRFNEVRLF